MIEISDLNFAYKKKSALFNALSLAFTPGKIYGLLGKNGAGKTTLLKIIAGLIYPQKGECTYNGVNVSKRIPDVLKEFFFLPETCTLPSVRIKEYLNLYSPFYPKFNYAAFNSFLEKFELNAMDNITGLSFGQKKKLSIAFALATESNIILLDEPTNGLDIPGKSVFRKLITSALTDDKTFIVSTHQVRDMKNIIEQIMIIDNGDVIFNYNIAEIENKISVTLLHEEPKDNEVLYYEKTLGGYASLAVCNEGMGSDIDIEFLFNAVISKGKEFENILNSGGSNE